MSKVTSGINYASDNGAQVSREGMLEAVSEDLDLSRHLSNPDPTITAEPVGVTEQGYGFAPQENMQERPSETIEEAQALQLRQEQMEAVNTFQDRHSTVAQGMSYTDLVSVFGERAGSIKDGMLRLGQVDQVVIPMTEGQDRTDTINSMSGVLKRQPKVLAEGEVDTQNYVDKQKTKPLNSAELLGHLGAVRLAKDGSTLQASPDWNILNLAMVEGNLAQQSATDSLIPPEMVKSMNSKEISDLTGVDESDIKSPISNGQLGRTIVEEWVKMEQRAKEGPEATIDAHLNPDNALTKEAYEQVGVMAKQTYAIAQPGIYQGVEVTTRNGMTRTDYQLTTAGMELLTRMESNLLQPKVVARPQVTVDATPTTRNATKTKEYTGDHYEAKVKRGEFVAEEEARINLASVRHVVNNVRLKAGMLLGLSGIQAAAQARLVSPKDLESDIWAGPLEAGMIIVSGNEAEMLGIGQGAADTINYASRNAGYRADNIVLQLEEITDMHSPRYISLSDELDMLRTFQIKSSDPQWRLKMYNRQSTRALQMMQDIAEFKDDPISFTNYLQKGTSRIGYSAQKMNMQNNKMARQMYGSGTIYTVTPGSHSAAEWAMLVTMGSHFFAETNSVPEETYKNMRRRIVNKDDKLIAIAAVGRKLKAMLAGYNVDSTTDALRKMDTVDNRIKGVKEVVATSDILVDDTQVKAFLDEAFKHPNEVVNLIEEAIELGNYMDSVESGNKPFDSSMRPIEVDGISNGLAALTAQLGVREVMYRIGVLREDPAKVLAKYDGVEGNLRQVLAENMRISLDTILQDKNINKDFNLNLDNKEEVLGLLELAIKNDVPFLKMPLMTLPYGQAIKSMSTTMLETVTTSPELTEIASRPNGIGVNKLSKLLHVILEKNLNKTLGAEVAEFAAAVQDMTDVAMAANEPIRFKKATGTWTSSNTSEQVATNKRNIDAKIMETWNEQLQDGSLKRRGKEILRARFGPTVKELGATGVKASGANAMKTGILAQAVISMDGSTMATTLSGEAYKRLQAQSGVKTPYVTAIYDAVIGDLGSFKSLMENINRTWIDTTMKFDLLKGLTDGAVDAQRRGGAKLQALSEKNPKGLVSNRVQASHVMASILNEISNNDTPAEGMVELFYKISTDAELRFNALTDSQKTTLRVSSPTDMITNKQMFALDGMVKPIMDRKIDKMRVVADAAKVRRSKLHSELGSNPVFQYHVDALKSFNFP